MDSISISRSNTESMVSNFISQIETEVMEAAEESRKTIIDAIDRSSGEFIDSLKEEVEREVELISEVGELLIAVTKYVQSAATAFADVDQIYSTSKVQ